MAQNKNQHFVPQHYLRQFCIKGTKNIATYRILPPLFIPSAPINKQCQKDYFYKNDEGVDPFLTGVETTIAPLLRQITEDRSYTPEEKQALDYLCVIMKMRTRKSIESMSLLPRNMFYKITEQAIKNGKLPPPPDDWSFESVGVNNVCSVMLRNSSLRCFAEMQTLHCKFIQAPKDSFFITSDNPVVTLNQALTYPKGVRSYAGFGRSGFQLLMPLSPRVCIFYYDPKVYKVGTLKQRVVPINSCDTEAINTLQLQSAEKCVYFHDPARNLEVDKLLRKYTNMRQPIEASYSEYETNDHSETILHTKEIQHQLPFRWQFCKLQRKPRYGNKNYRDENWSRLIDLALEEIERNPNKELGDIFEVMEEVAVKL